MNDEDWLRKRLRNRRPGCVLGLPLGLLLWSLTLCDRRLRRPVAILWARRR